CPAFRIPYTSPTNTYTLSLHDALPISKKNISSNLNTTVFRRIKNDSNPQQKEDLAFAIQNMESLCNNKDDVKLLRESLLSLAIRSEEHTSELQSRFDLVCRLLLEKKNV